jgi:hypothetical protein
MASRAASEELENTLALYTRLPGIERSAKITYLMLF